MSDADAKSSKRIVAECLGVVHRRFADNDPPVVGTQFVSADPEHGFEVRFLLPVEHDVSRAGGELLPRMKRTLADALALHGATAPTLVDIRVTISSLEGQGIRASPAHTRRYR